MKSLILQKILQKKNIILVGPMDSGKSYFIQNQLLPLLNKTNLEVIYFEDCDKLNLNYQAGALIVDEVELLFDKDFLENQHSKDMPFYSESYLNKVKRWHEKLSKVKVPIVCVVKRNSEIEINNLLKNYDKLEWNNLPTEVIKFSIKNR